MRGDEDALEAAGAPRGEHGGGAARCRGQGRDGDGGAGQAHRGEDRADQHRQEAQQGGGQAGRVQAQLDADAGG